MSNLIGLDLGMGALKLYGSFGGVQLPSQVAVNGAQHVGNLIGLGRVKPPQMISTEHGDFYVGAGAHDWGRAVENLGFDRLTGSPEITALFYGVLTQAVNGKTCNLPTAFDSIYAGLPVQMLSGAQAQANKRQVRAWLNRTHVWDQAGKQPCAITVNDTKPVAQPVGAVFDFMLDDTGQFHPGRKPLFRSEFGVISIGFNTVELQVVRDRRPIPEMTRGTTVGVRRLLELYNRQGHYTLGELDTLLRNRSLDVGEYLPIWQREITGFVEQVWGQKWRRFAQILIVGGGALLAQDLPDHFNGRAKVLDDPVMSIARGLYKLAVLKERK